MATKRPFAALIIAGGFEDLFSAVIPRDEQLITRQAAKQFPLPVAVQEE